MKAIEITKEMRAAGKTDNEIIEFLADEIEKVYGEPPLSLRIQAMVESLMAGLHSIYALVLGAIGAEDVPEKVQQFSDSMFLAAQAQLYDTFFGGEVDGESISETPAEG